MEIFGYNINKKSKPEKVIESPVNPTSDDGSTVMNSGAGFYGYNYSADLDGSLKNESDLIKRYRDAAQYPDCDSAIEDIVNEAINTDEDEVIVKLSLDTLKLSDKVKERFNEEFSTVLKLLKFEDRAHEIFKQWYVDGRIYYHPVVDKTKLKDGIQELRYIDPRKIRKIKSVVKEKNAFGVEIVKGTEEYYLYNEKGVAESNATGLKMAPESVVLVTSGNLDPNTGIAQSYIHKAMKPVNQLRMLEDAMVIFRITRAPERRIFYIDVGNLPKQKAEQYVQDIMNKFKNKIVYNSETGETRDDRRFTSMMEDFWMPRRDGCFSLDTKIKLLDGRDVELGQLIVEHKLGKENWVYSVGPNGEVVPGLISWAGVTRNDATVIDIHLDNGEIITCTPDHKFILRNGEKIKAEDLQCGSSLMPLYSNNLITTNTENVDDKFYKDIWDKLLKYRVNHKDHTDKQIKVKHEHGNHKVIKVVIREDLIDVGTLTIDEHHLYHDYHNFALSSGIFVMNSKGTEITTLPGLQNMGNNDDVTYFQQKLFQALNVPMSRLTPGTPFSSGRSSEITRDEIKFTKFISRLRRKFSKLLSELLKTQLILKGIVSNEDWLEIRDNVKFIFAHDDHFAEFKNNEILTQRISLLQAVDPFVGKYYSTEWVKKNVLMLGEDDIKSDQKQIDKEKMQEPQPEDQPQPEQQE